MISTVRLERTKEYLYRFKRKENARLRSVSEIFQVQLNSMKDCDGEMLSEGQVKDKV